MSVCQQRSSILQPTVLSLSVCLFLNRQWDMQTLILTSWPVRFNRKELSFYELTFACIYKTWNTELSPVWHIIVTTNNWAFWSSIDVVSKLFSHFSEEFPFEFPGHLNPIAARRVSQFVLKIIQSWSDLTRESNNEQKNINVSVPSQTEQTLQVSLTTNPTLKLSWSWDNANKTGVIVFIIYSVLINWPENLII